MLEHDVLSPDQRAEAERPLTAELRGLEAETADWARRRDAIAAEALVGKRDSAHVSYQNCEVEQERRAKQMTMIQAALRGVAAKAQRYTPQHAALAQCAARLPLLEEATELARYQILGRGLPHHEVPQDALDSLVAATSERRTLAAALREITHDAARFGRAEDEYRASDWLRGNPILLERLKPPTVTRYPWEDLLAVVRGDTPPPSTSPTASRGLAEVST
jgi:hypothetical protein